MAQARDVEQLVADKRTRGYNLNQKPKEPSQTMAGLLLLYKFFWRLHSCRFHDSVAIIHPDAKSPRKNPGASNCFGT